MPKPIPVSTFKIFRHNFLTNEWSRFLYEGHYYPFKESHIGKVSLSKKKAKTFWIKFIIPNVWLSEYTRGVYSLSQTFGIINLIQNVLAFFLLKLTFPIWLSLKG